MSAGYPSVSGVDWRFICDAGTLSPTIDQTLMTDNPWTGNTLGIAYAWIRLLLSGVFKTLCTEPPDRLEHQIEICSRLDHRRIDFEY